MTPGGSPCKGGGGTRQMQFYFNPERRKLALDGVEQAGTAEYLRLARLVYFKQYGPGTGAWTGGRPSAVPGFSRAARSNRSTGQICGLTNGRCDRATGCSRVFRCGGGEVEAYDTPLLEAGQLLTRLRRSLVEELLPWAARAQATIRASATPDAVECVDPGIPTRLG